MFPLNDKGFGVRGHQQPYWLVSWHICLINTFCVTCHKSYSWSNSACSAVLTILFVIVCIKSNTLEASCCLYVNWEQQQSYIFMISTLKGVSISFHGSWSVKNMWRSSSNHVICCQQTWLWDHYFGQLCGLWSGWTKAAAKVKENRAKGNGRPPHKMAQQGRRGVRPPHGRGKEGSCSYIYYLLWTIYIIFQCLLQYIGLLTTSNYRWIY